MISFPGEYMVGIYTAGDRHIKNLDYKTGSLMDAKNYGDHQIGKHIGRSYRVTRTIFDSRHKQERW